MNCVGSLETAATACEKDIARQGFHNMGQVADADLCRGVLARVLETRKLDASLFLDQAAFEANPVHTGVNPKPGRNLAEAFDPEVHAILQTPAVHDMLVSMLGPQFSIFNCKFVCGIPVSILPQWVKDKVTGNGVNNLGAYMREPYRDITYFYGIDYHQDIIDWKDREPDFLTLYVYLDHVGTNDAPIYVLEGSHALGSTVFPHLLTPEDDHFEYWRYANGAEGAAARDIRVRQHRVTGEAGNVALWHACTLHGTQPSSNDRPRVSLRYLLARDPAAQTCGLDRINAGIKGPLATGHTRDDLDEEGAARLKKNHLRTVTPGE